MGGLRGGTPFRREFIRQPESAETHVAVATASRFHDAATAPRRRRGRRRSVQEILGAAGKRRDGNAGVKRGGNESCRRGRRQQWGDAGQRDAQQVRGENEGRLRADEVLAWDGLHDAPLAHALDRLFHWLARDRRARRSGGLIPAAIRSAVAKGRAASCTTISGFAAAFASGLLSSGLLARNRVPRAAPRANRLARA